MQSTINQTRHWFSARSKLSDELISSLTAASSRASSFFDSCKEQSFSEFSSAAAGDSWSFWLPKSFNCSFCRREFRSAQALGGHMNVHRVERVRLKLASSSNLNPSTSSESECNPNPNPNPNSSSQSSENNCGKNLLVKGSMDLKLGREEMDFGKRKEFCVGYDVVSNNKKKKTTDLMLAFSCTSYKDELELCKIYGPIKDEEVDLELRLGDPPKLKQGCKVVVIS